MKLYTEGPQILKTKVQNVVTVSTVYRGILRPCLQNSGCELVATMYRGILRPCLQNSGCELVTTE